MARAYPSFHSPPFPPKLSQPRLVAKGSAADASEASAPAKR
jgi:hypothetical protein